MIKYSGTTSKTTKLDYEKPSNKINRDYQSSYNKKSENKFEENDQRKKDLMSKLHELNKKYSPTKSQTEPEKASNTLMKRDFLYESPKSQLQYESKTYIWNKEDFQLDILLLDL